MLQCLSTQPPSCVFFSNQAMDGLGKLGFSHCIGAVDDAHIQIYSPMGCGSEFINRMCTYSVLIQGTTNNPGWFIDVEISYSRRNHDACVFKLSALCKPMVAGLFVPQNSCIYIVDVRIPPLIVADAAILYQGMAHEDLWCAW